MAAPKETAWGRPREEPRHAALTRVGKLSGDSTFIGLTYEGANPFPEEKFLDPWWPLDAGLTWPQINDYRDIAGNESATPNNAAARIAKISSGIAGATEAPPLDLKNLSTRLVAYAADMRSKYAEHAGQTLKESAQYKGLKAAGALIVSYITTPAGGVVFSKWLEWSVDLGEDILKGLNALGWKVGPQKDIEAAEANLDAMKDCFTANLKLAVPPAWQTLGLPVIVGSDNASTPYIKDAVCYNFYKWEHMPRVDRDVVVQWWALYLMQADDPEIATAFAGLWNSSALADDTQVLLVAMPIAKAAGIPWKSFAEQLWARSAGYRGRPDLLLGWDGGSLIPMAAGLTPANASNVQWQVLASDAFKLAEEIKGKDTLALTLALTGPISGSKPSDRPTSKPSGEPVNGKRSGTIPGRSGSIPGRSPGAPRYGTPMASWSGGPQTPSGISDKTKGGIGAVAIIGGIILGGIMLLRGGHA